MKWIWVTLGEEMALEYLLKHTYLPIPSTTTSKLLLQMHIGPVTQDRLIKRTYLGAAYLWAAKGFNEKMADARVLDWWKNPEDILHYDMLMTNMLWNAQNSWVSKALPLKNLLPVPVMCSDKKLKSN